MGRTMLENNAGVQWENLLNNGRNNSPISLSFLTSSHQHRLDSHPIVKYFFQRSTAKPWRLQVMFRHLWFWKRKEQTMINHSQVNEVVEAYLKISFDLSTVIKNYYDCQLQFQKQKLTLAYMQTYP